MVVTIVVFMALNQGKHFTGAPPWTHGLHVTFVPQWRLPYATYNRSYLIRFKKQALISMVATTFSYRLIGLTTPVGPVGEHFFEKKCM